jgi:hypothetical protein
MGVVEARHHEPAVKFDYLRVGPDEAFDIGIGTDE